MELFVISIHYQQIKGDLFSKYLIKDKNMKNKTTLKIKKSDFQKEIEQDERRLEEIYNKILGLYRTERNLEIPANNCLVNVT